MARYTSVMSARTAASCIRWLALPVLALAVSPPAAADVYRWRDAQGQLHFGDRPPAKVRFERFEPRAGIKNMDDRSGNAGAQGDETAQADGPDCGEARDRLAEYRVAERIVETNALGEERELTADERQRLVERQQGIVDAACGAGG